jgi:hypothetical protein
VVPKIEPSAEFLFVLERQPAVPGSDARHEQRRGSCKISRFIPRAVGDDSYIQHRLEGSYCRPHCVTQGALVLNAENSLANSD